MNCQTTDTRSQNRLFQIVNQREVVKTLVPKKKHHGDINLNSRISANDLNYFFATTGNLTCEQATTSTSQQDTGRIRPLTNILRPQPVK